MDDTVHSRRSAVHTNPHKRIPPSFYAALGIAVAVHAGFAYYLLSQGFGQALMDEGYRPDDPPPMIIEIPAPKPAEPVIENTVPVHKAPVAETVTETIPIAPVEDPVPLADAQIVPVLPTIPSTGATTGTGTSDASAEPVHVTARWTRFPDSAALADYYPARAADNEVEGSATVQCVVLDTAGRVSCVTVSEKPGGYGFGHATVRMVQDKGRVDISQGNVQVGSVLRQTVVWKLF